MVLLPAYLVCCWLVQMDEVHQTGNRVSSTVPKSKLSNNLYQFSNYTPCDLIQTAERNIRKRQYPNRAFLRPELKIVRFRIRMSPQRAGVKNEAEDLLEGLTLHLQHVLV
jgi:hypothetical protein